MNLLNLTEEAIKILSENTIFDEYFYRYGTNFSEIIEDYGFKKIHSHSALGRCWIKKSFVAEVSGMEAFRVNYRKFRSPRSLNSYTFGGVTATIDEEEKVFKILTPFETSTVNCRTYEYGDWTYVVDGMIPKHVAEFFNPFKDEE